MLLKARKKLGVMALADLATSPVALQHKLRPLEQQRRLLAFDTPQSLEEYAAVMGQSSDFSLGTRSRAEFYAKLKEIRDAGFALGDDEVTKGMAAVGAPIIDHRGHVMASLSVSGLRDSILHESDSSPSIIDVACDGARRLSTYFGAQHPPSSGGPPRPTLGKPKLPPAVGETLGAAADDAESRPRPGHVSQLRR